MIFEKVVIKDFMAIKSAEVDLENRGLVTVAGENHVNSSADSNGSGKSTLGAAICWCLYNKTDRGVSGDDVIRHKTKEAVVSVTLKDSEGSYRIERSRKKGKGITQVVFTSKSGDVSDLTRGTEALTQEVINRIIGSTYEVFCAAVYMQQGNLICLPEMNDRGLKELVEQAAGLTELSRAFLIAKEELSEKKRRLEQCEAVLNSAEIVFSEADIFVKDRERAEASHKEAEQRREREFNLERENVIKRSQTLADVLSGMPTKERLERALASLKTKLDSVEENNQRVADIEIKHNTKLQEAKMIYERSKVVTENASKILAEINDVESKIGTQCSECGSEITPDHIKDVRESLLEKRRLALSGAESLKDEAKSIVKKAKAEYEAAIKSVARLSTAEIVEKIEKVRTALDRRAQVERDIASVESKLSEKFVPREMDYGTEEAKERLERRKHQLEKAKKECKAARLDFDEAKAVCSVFDVSGVRAQILDTVTPFLNEKTAEYLAVLTDGTFQVVWTTLKRKKDGTLAEKFSVEVKNVDTNKSYKSCSGGEKRRVALACALALQDLVAARAEKAINLLIADEIDDALDVSGLERLMSVMQEKAKAKGTILVISHNDLKSWIGNSFTVIKGKDGSVLECG